MGREMTDQLMKGIKQTKLMNPPTDCVSPIKSELFSLEPEKHQKVG